VIRVGPRVVDSHAAERRAPVLLLVPDVEDRALVRTGLAVAAGMRTRLRCWALREPGEDLPVALRVALYGLAARSEADRAVRQMVDAAVRGAHVATRPMGADDEEARREIAVIHGAGAGAPLLCGWTAGGPGPEPERLRRAALPHPGALIVVRDVETATFSEVLALDPCDDGSSARDALVEAARCLERGYPLWRRRTTEPRELASALRDCRETTLALVSLDGERGLSLLGSWGRDGGLETLVPGTLAFVLPRGDSRAPLLDALLALAPAPQQQRLRQRREIPDDVLTGRGESARVGGASGAGGRDSAPGGVAPAAGGEAGEPGDVSGDEDDDAPFAAGP
jgi:hypothetical protein